MNTEYWEALDAFLDREMEPQKAAEMGLLAAQVAPFGAYIRDALAIRAAFPGVGDVSVPTGFAESVLAALPEQTGGAADAAENPEDKPGVSRKSEAARIPEAEEEREAARIPEAEEDREATREVDTRAIVDGVARLAAAYEREGKVAGVPDWDSGPDRADDLNQANGRTDGWQEKWKKAALPLAACMALVLLVAGGFALSRGGGTPPAADNSNKNTFVTAASDGTESPSISLGAGAAEFRRMEEDGEEEAALQDAKDAAADAGGEESAPAEAEAAKEEAPPTPAPTEAPRQPSPTPSPKPSPTPTPTPTPTPVPTPTEAPPTPTPEPEPDPAANLPARNGAGEEPQSAQDAGDENPWDNVELTLPDDAGYLFERYTPLEEETGGALYAFSREQYAALLDALDAAGFITHTSMPSESATIYVYLETESAGDWEEGAEEGSEGEAETEPDFDPEEGGETEDGETGSAASGSSEVEDFARR